MKNNDSKLGFHEGNLLSEDQSRNAERKPCVVITRFCLGSIELFINLSYANFDSKRARASGGAAALEIKNKI